MFARCFGALLVQTGVSLPLRHILPNRTTTSHSVSSCYFIFVSPSANFEAVNMLDFFTIFSKGGIVLWCFQSTSQLFTPSVNALIKSVILQVRKL
jgi:hypothetical protein